MTDGRYAVCLLDRNGLRPARWVTTTNGFITIASEIGVWDYQPEDVMAGPCRPGQILAVDTETGQILDTDAIDNRLKSRHPYKQWLRRTPAHPGDLRRRPRFGQLRRRPAQAIHEDVPGHVRRARPGAAPLGEQG
jgi:hypothetical protein